jgi:hypothetical protein
MLGHRRHGSRNTGMAAERRAAASKAARARAQAVEAKSVAKIRRKKAAPRSKPKEMSFVSPREMTRARVVSHAMSMRRI